MTTRFPQPSLARFLAAGAALVLLTLLIASSAATPRAFAAGDAVAVARAFLADSHVELGLTKDDVDGVLVSDHYRSAHNGVSHVYFQQTHQAIPLHNALLNVNVLDDGTIAGYGNRFAPDLAQAVNTDSPVISSLTAVNTALNLLNLVPDEPLQPPFTTGAGTQAATYDVGAVALEPVKASLLYREIDGAIRLTWDVQLYEADARHYWQMAVDAVTGVELARADWVVHENWSDGLADTPAVIAPDHAGPALVAAAAPALNATDSTYRVFPPPIESPNHAAVTPPGDGRTVVGLSADNLIGSPFGWHDTNGAAGGESGGVATFPGVTLASGASVRRTFQVVVDPGLGTTLYFEDNFKAGLGQWTTSGLWNLESDSDTCGSTVAPFPNPSQAAYYGDDVDCDFATGGQNTGSLTLNAAVDLTTAAGATLTFDSYEDTENDTTYDKKFVEISTNAGASWTQLALLSTENAWYEPSIDLASYVGNDVLLRFRFDSTDGFLNSDLGWLVDDVLVANVSRISNTACVTAAEGDNDCVTIETVVEGTPLTPVIEVDPASLSSTQATNDQITKTLTISNTGQAHLNWTIVDDSNLASPDTQTWDAGPAQKDDGSARAAQQAAFLADQQPVQGLAPLAYTPCVSGSAAGYPCNNVDLAAFLPLSNIGGGSGTDIWGWTSAGGREIAIMARSTGTAFVDITDPVNPVYLGNLPTHTSNSSWRDVKVYADHAFIGSEASSHGMQIFDLNTLPAATDPGLPLTFSKTAHFNGFGSSHNIVINEASGYAFGVGTNTCSGGLHFVDISTPTTPVDAGCYSSDGYTHDAQCVLYNGPDTAHVGKEICFNSNEDTLTIVDVSNKAAPALISRTGYSGSGYTHQGWLTDDHSLFLLNDETDETTFGHNTRTRVWDVSDLDLPTITATYDGATGAIDHNLYVEGNHVYEANYRAGLRILELTTSPSVGLAEIAYFDVYPTSNSASYNGAWSVYPYFPSGVVVVSGMEQGLFVLQPNLTPAPPDTCESPVDVPWLSANPAGGTTGPGASTAVDVVFDSTGLATGVYTGTLCINSNDPLMSLVEVPVTMEVADCAPPSHVSDLIISAGGNDAVLNWTANGADHYEVWTGTNEPYVTPGASCAAAGNCSTVTSPTYTHVGALGNPVNNYSYSVVAVNACGQTSAASNLEMGFSFTIAPGTP